MQRGIFTAKSLSREAQIATPRTTLYATRVESYVVPGHFRQALAEKPSLRHTTEMTPPNGSEYFNVKREGRAEPDLLVRLYRLEF
jgi:hypothetical protein